MKQMQFTRESNIYNKRKVHFVVKLIKIPLNQSIGMNRCHLRNWDDLYLYFAVKYANFSLYECTQHSIQVNDNEQFEKEWQKNAFDIVSGDTGAGSGFVSFSVTFSCSPTLFAILSRFQSNFLSIVLPAKISPCAYTYTIHITKCCSL